MDRIDKKNPLFTASIASAIYFVIFLLLKYLLPVKRETNNIKAFFSKTNTGNTRQSGK